MKNCLASAELKSLAAALIDGLKAELYLTPKPGLVDLLNCGSHPDLSLETMSRSIVLLRDYLAELVEALLNSRAEQELLAIGQRAEQRMYRTLGTNCHRGGIFLCGLLLVGAARAGDCAPFALRAAVQQTATQFFAGGRDSHSHGALVRQQFPRAGILAEALQGLPAIFELVVPTLLERKNSDCQGAFWAMAKLMQRVEDSTSLYRCGSAGLEQLRKGGVALEQCLAAGEDPVSLLCTMDREFSRCRLTMGGVADLLGVGLGYVSFLRQRGASEK